MSRPTPVVKLPAAPAVSTSASAASSASSSSSMSYIDRARSLPVGWRWAVGGAVLGVIQLACAYIKIRARREGIRDGEEEGEDDDNDTMPELEAASTSAAPSRSSKRRNIPRQWNAEDFARTTSSFLQELAQNNSLDPDIEQELRAALPQVLTFGNEMRALGAHFLLATNAHYLTMSQTESEFNGLMVKQDQDMRLAWGLLECPNSTPDESRSLDVMRLQVAQCLKDPELMLPIFERMTSRSLEDLNDEELILLFTAAPLLGRWAQTVALGDRLGTMHELSDFHTAPMDFQQLYELSKLEQTKGNVPTEQLQWKNFKILMQRIKLRTIECSNDSLVDEMKSEFTENGSNIWKTLPVPEQMRLVRCGALAQLRSFSPVPLALVGPASDSRILVQGYADLAEPQGDLPAPKQTETYELNRVEFSELEGSSSSSSSSSSSADAIHWRGTYTMVQGPPEGVPADAYPMPQLKVVFDFEMTIQNTV